MKCFLNDNELMYFDMGFNSGVYAALEEVVKRHPLVEEDFNDIVDKVCKYAGVEKEDKK